MKPERIVIYACVGAIYLVTLVATLFIPSVAASMTAGTRQQLADLEPKLRAASEAAALNSQSTGALRMRVQIAKLNDQLQKLDDQIALACKAQPADQNTGNDLLDLTQRIDANLTKDVTISDLALNLTQGPAPAATPSTAPSPSSPATQAPDNTQSGESAVNALQDPNAAIQQATQQIRTVVSGPNLTLTLHGPFPSIMNTLNTLTHRETAIAFSLLSVTRSQANPLDVDAKFNVAEDHVPGRACDAIAAATTKKQPESKPHPKLPHSQAKARNR